MLRNGPTRTCLAAALLWLSVSRLAAQTSDVTLSLGGESRPEVHPGTVTNLSIQIINTSPNAHQMEVELRLPEGWRPVSLERSLELRPRAREITLIAVSVPSSAAAGRYDIVYALRDRASASFAGELYIPVMVAPVRQLQLTVIDAPRFIRAGQEITAHFSLTNLGNAPATIRLTARSQMPIAVDSLLLHLPPRARRSVRAVTPTDEDAPAELIRTVDLKAVLIPDSTVSTSASAVVKVLPRSPNASTSYRQLPMTLKLRLAGQNRLSGVQLEAAGGGAVDDSAQEQMEFLIRTPDIQSRSLLAERDEYRLRYMSRRFEAHVGDHAFSLSPLTEFGRYAFGAGGRFTTGEVTIGGFVNRTRFLAPHQDEGAGFIEYQVDPSSRIGLNYLHTREQFTGNMLTLRGLVRPFGLADADLEVGTGSSGGKSVLAGSAWLHGRGSWGAYEARVLHAGTGYPGYYRDVDFKTASLSLFPLRDFRIEGYFRDERRNLQHDTLQYFAPADRYLQVGVGFRDLISLYYRNVLQEDRLPRQHYRQMENTLILRSGLNGAAASFYLNAEAGKVRDRLLGTESPFRRIGLFAGLRPVSWNTTSFSLEYARERALFTDESPERLSGSVGLSIQVAGRMRMMASLFGSRSLRSPAQSYSMADIALEHVFPGGHTLTLRGRQSIFTPSQEGKDLAYLIEYALPIGIPWGRLPDARRISGKVIDLETGSPLSDVLLFADGMAAASDAGGDFFFSSLKQDTVYLQVDPASVGLDRVTMQPLPMQLTVGKGEEISAQIGVTRGGSVGGVVMQYDSSVSAEGTRTLRPSAGVGDLIIQLEKDPADIQRRITDSKGRFSFRGVRPGTWRLRIVGGRLPERHLLDREETLLSVTPGSAQEVELRVLPHFRTLQMLDEGKVLDVRRPTDLQVKTPLPAPARRWFVRKAWKARGYFVIGAPWAAKREALLVMQKAARFSGRRSWIVLMPSRKGPSYYQVRIGVFGTRRAAEAQLARVLTVAPSW